MPDQQHPIQLGAGIAQRIHEQMWLRADDATSAMQAATRAVLSGPRSGTTRKEKGRVVMHSAPGEPPAEISGELLGSWIPFIHERTSETGFSVSFGVQSVGVPYVSRFDPRLPGYTGSTRVAPRPFVDAILQRVQPTLQELFLARRWLA
jgi:hypothetical protein